MQIGYISNSTLLTKTFHIQLDWREHHLQKPGGVYICFSAAVRADPLLSAQPIRCDDIEI